MIRRYHNKASIFWNRVFCDSFRDYHGDGRHRRRKQYVKALWSLRVVIKC